MPRIVSIAHEMPSIDAWGSRARSQPAGRVVLVVVVVVGCGAVLLVVGVVLVVVLLVVVVFGGPISTRLGALVE